MVTSEIIDELHEGEIGLIDNVLVSIEQEERSKLIHQALSQLNEDEQMIVTLYYFEEMSLREISEIVMISMDNIKVKLFRSRKKLFDILKHKMGLLIERS